MCNEKLFDHISIDWSDSWHEIWSRASVWVTSDCISGMHLENFLDSLANHFNINTAISSLCWLLRLTIIQWAGRLLVFSLTHSAKLHGQEVPHYFGKQVSVSRLEQDRDPLNNYLHFFAVIFIRRWTLN